MENSSGEVTRLLVELKHGKRDAEKQLIPLLYKELRRIAVWKLEGYSLDEIATQLGCARRTVARRLELVRTLWRATAR